MSWNFEKRRRINLNKLFSFSLSLFSLIKHSRKKKKKKWGKYSHFEASCVRSRIKWVLGLWKIRWNKTEIAFIHPYNAGKGRIWCKTITNKLNLYLNRSSISRLLGRYRIFRKISDSFGYFREIIQFLGLHSDMNGNIRKIVKMSSTEWNITFAVIAHGTYQIRYLKWCNARQNLALYQFR